MYGQMYVHLQSQIKVTTIKNSTTWKIQQSKKEFLIY